MALIIMLLIFADSVLHKGLIRVMLPKKFPDLSISAKQPSHKAVLINAGKEWIKAVNTIELMNKVESKSSGLEFDIYFDTGKKMFDVHHDVDNSTGLNFDDLLQAYNKRGLVASIWMDFKNLADTNCTPALAELIRLRDKYKLTNKILVESNRVDLLKHFGDSSFFTSYYTPFFNPYLINDDSIKQWVNKLTAIVNASTVDALSGYYFQYPFLHTYFPGYPILIWSPNDKMSIINQLYKIKIRNTPEVFIAL